MYTYNNILIDGDAIAFSAACTGQLTQFNVVDSHEKEVIVYTAKKDATKYIAESLRDDLRIVKVVTSPPLWLVKKIIDNKIEEIRKELNCDEYTVFIGAPKGTLTFRHRLAKTALYKGNRTDPKPEHLEAALEYLVTEYNAIRAIDEEADDLLGIAQCETNATSIIATRDKDLRMIPGWHYHIDSKEQTFVSDPGTISLVQTKSGKKLVGTGLMWMAAQCLLGDKVDNIIKPTKKHKHYVGEANGLALYDSYVMGDVGVYKYLTNTTNSTILEIWKRVQQVYTQAEVDINENADLLWVKREMNTTWRDYIK